MTSWASATVVQLFESAIDRGQNKPHLHTCVPFDPPLAPMRSLGKLAVSSVPADRRSVGCCVATETEAGVCSYPLVGWRH